MLATAFLSMWVSNTAVATMMLPIALAVGEKFRPGQHGQHDQSDQEDQYNFGIALMLAIAYDASIGGVATLIGTPPNAVLAGAAQELLGIQISFVEWMSVGPKDSTESDSERLSLYLRGLTAFPWMSLKPGDSIAGALKEESWLLMLGRFVAQPRGGC